MEHSPDGASDGHRTYVTDGGGEIESDDADGPEGPNATDPDGGDETADPELAQAKQRLEEQEGNIGFDSESGDWIDEGSAEDDWDGSSVSRRGMVGYLGGTMVGIFGLAGAGWFAFIREQTDPAEQVVIDYWDYIDRAKYNSAVLIFHRNAPVEPISARMVAFYSQASIDVPDTEIIDERDDVDLPGVETLALVRAEISLDWGTSTDTMNPAFAVAENEENNWRMWDDGRNSDQQY